MQVFINNTMIKQLCQPIQGDIEQMSIFYSPIDMLTLQIRKEDIPKIADWFYDLSQRCTCDYINFNGTLIKKEEVKKHNPQGEK